MPAKARHVGVWGAIGVVVAVVVYAVVALTLVGWAWPYPSRLPDTFSFHGNTYHRVGSACKPLAWYRHQRGIGGGRTRVHRVGTLPSALWFGSRPLYSYFLDPSFSNTYDWVLVQDGNCYRSHGGDIQF